MVIRWTSLAPLEFELPFPGSLTSTFLWQEMFHDEGRWGMVDDDDPALFLSNRLSQSHGFVPQDAGFGRSPVQMKDLKTAI